MGCHRARLCGARVSGLYIFRAKCYFWRIFLAQETHGLGCNGAYGGAYASGKISLAAPPPGMTAEDVKQIMPASQLHRGMKGYGLTVFHGTKIEKFDVEVLGVMKQMNTGRDWILVRVSCPIIKSRSTGIIQGMSGSPVYIDGKLIGAISAGMVFAKEPVGMITPIADMLEAWDQNLPKVASGYSSPQTLPESVTVDGRKATSVELDPPGNPGHRPK